MYVFKALEIAAGLLLALVFVTQIAYPLFKGRKTFPIFGRQGKLESDLAAAKQAEFEDGLEKEVQKVKSKTETKQGV